MELSGDTLKLALPNNHELIFLMFRIKKVENSAHLKIIKIVIIGLIIIHFEKNRLNCVIVPNLCRVGETVVP